MEPRGPQPASNEKNSYSLTHLKYLEAESIHIIREVAAEFDNPGHAVLHR